MKLQVIRQEFDDICTIGTMTINGVFECYTLEPVVRPVDAEKIPNKTAIPYGTYQVTITYSPHFKRDMPLVNNVPNFEGVRIHSGNWAADTEGCCLVGGTKSKDAIFKSSAEFTSLFSKIKSALDFGEAITIEYIKED